ncbi:3-oxoacyl-ACP reductase [Streptomyces tubbatahanensis]|uniref:3-oxoacyl-ACP reductase n=1 Tax=Streptomyces tubbatahanensis TaxID=2923272 RepID=A0ABY3XV04_9ACTN|nr:3-oxoacyl-ACP reductase [Streptomyces tubbatahanensis]UNS98323.1 3-oxoacyl-ACP reductase [Streptomyces tubbatahanensis]
MADRYLRWTHTGPGRFLTRRLGLPRPEVLHRWTAERPTLEGGPLLHLTATATEGCGRKELREALDGCGLPVVDGRTDVVHGRTDGEGRVAAVLVDATALGTVAELSGVHASLHPLLRRLAPCGRVVLLGARPAPDDHHQAAAQQALEGFVRSLGKELGRGRTANLVRLAPPARVDSAASTLRFLLSPRSAFVSGQVIEVTAEGHAPGTADGGTTKNGDGSGSGEGRRLALVTGAARGIGEQIAGRLAREGAHVLCLDVEQAADDLTRVADRLGGTALPLDITAGDAGARIVEALPDGRLDVLVHNAGITRDRRLVNMPADRWAGVLDVNLASVLRTTDHLLAAGALRGSRVVATASIAGIAGNVGQTNYAASKAGVIGFVRALAPRARAEHATTVNAVAPGFIETKMTAAVPFVIREAGRRMNSLSQGGQPLDVAETVAWLAEPASHAVNGQTVRVCGQSLLGA